MFVRPLAHLGGRQNKPPVWQTPTGQILSVAEGDTASVQLVALDLDEHDVLTYSVVGGALPDGFALSSSGLLSGTAGTISTDPTVSSFTVRVTDGKAPRTRDFSVAVKKRFNVLLGNGTATNRALVGYKSFDDPVVNISATFAKPLTAAVLHHDKLFASNGQSILTSAGDGVWSVAAARAGIVSMATNGTLIVGVGTALRATSSDGVNWTTQPATGLTYQRVKWDGSSFWAVHNAALQRSLDGLTWTNVAVPGTGTVMEVESNGVGGVIVTRNTNQTNLYVSNDNGQTWTPSTTGTFSKIVKYWPAQSLWLKGGGTRLESSPDGVTWTNAGTNSVEVTEITLIDDRVAVAYSTTVSSKTATSFSMASSVATIGTTTSGGGHRGYTMVYQPSANRLWTFGSISDDSQNSGFAAGTCRIATIAVPASGNTLGPQTDDFFFATRVSEGGFVPACWTGREFIIPQWGLWTPNGHDYRYITANAFELTTAALYDSDANIYIIATGGIRSCAPEDFLTASSYTLLAGGASITYNDLERNDTLYIAVGNSGNIWTAPVGSPTTWTKRTSGTTNMLKAACWTGQRWLVLGLAGSAAYMTTSNDGITWTAFPDSGRQFTVGSSNVTLPIMQDIASDGNGNVVMVGTHRMVSTNHGQTWTTAGSNENGFGVEWSPTLGTFVATATAITFSNPASPPQKVRGVYNTVAVR